MEPLPRADTAAVSLSRMVADCEERLPGLLAAREGAKSTRERKQFSSRIRTTRMLLRWAKSRAGYVPPPRRKKVAASG